MGFRLPVAIVTVLLDCGLIDWAVHPLNLVIHPMILRFGRPTFVPMLTAMLVEKAYASCGVPSDPQRSRSAHV